MLKIRILNAGKGDCILVSFHENERVHYILVDSNYPSWGSESTSPLVEYLEENNVRKLSMIVLTHPHADHYSGLLQIFDRYEVDQILCYPTFLENTARLKALVKMHAKFIEDESPQIRKPAEEFIGILKFLKANEHKVTQAIGPENTVRPLGFDDVSIQVVLPFRRDLGRFVAALERGDDRVVYDKNLNSLSVALWIKYQGVEVVLGADGPVDAWRLHRKTHAKHSDALINATLVKIPHHGSRTDASAEVLNYLFKQGGENSIALISASGARSHPSPFVIDELARRGIKPYCTNLADRCTSVRRLYADRSIDAGLMSLVNQTAVESPYGKLPCQGWIEASIDVSGQISVQTQTSAVCGFRNETIGS